MALTRTELLPVVNNVLKPSAISFGLPIEPVNRAPYAVATAVQLAENNAPGLLKKFFQASNTCASLTAITMAPITRPVNIARNGNNIDCLKAESLDASLGFSGAAVCGAGGGGVGGILEDWSFTVYFSSR